MKKEILRYIGIFVVTLMGLWLLLIGAAMISNKKIEEKMLTSAYMYGRTEAFAFCDEGKWSGIADNYADSIWLNIAWYMGNGNPVYATLDTKYYDGEERGENYGLYLAVTDETTEANKEYTRYWHGTAGIIRVLHLFTDVKGIKNVGLCVTFLLAVILVIMLIMDKKMPLAIGFSLSLCAVEIWKIGLSIEYQPAFILCFLMSILYLRSEKKGDNRLVGLSVCGGVLTAFFDFLTTETTVLLVPLILVVVVRSMDGRLEELKKSVIWITKCGVAWVLSYGSTFVTKWTLVSIATGINQFGAAFSAVEERVTGPVEDMIPGGIIGQSFFAVISNVAVFFGAESRVDFKLVFIGIVLSAGVFFSLLYLFQKKERNKTAEILLLLLGSIVFLRYLVLANQSYLHCFFTYRGLLSVVLALIGILAVDCQLPYNLKATGKKKRRNTKR